MQSSVADWQKLEQESPLRSSVRTDLLEWATHVLKFSDQTPAAHHRLLIGELQALSDGRIDRLLVHMPPGSAKSTFANVNTDLWGGYVPTPSTAGPWYAWASGTDGSGATVYSTAFTVS